jgi:curved DNA-binding protein CbpA
MDREHGLRNLGLPPDAGPGEVRRAYRKQCLPLKTQLLTAPRAWLKDRYREQLRELVQARDAALGLPDRTGWRARPLMSGSLLFRTLVRTQAGDLDDRDARRFLGVPPAADREEVMNAYRLRARALVRCLANAKSDEEMRAIRRARAKLRTIRNFALARAS